MNDLELLLEWYIPYFSGEDGCKIEFNKKQDKMTLFVSNKPGDLNIYNEIAYFDQESDNFLKFISSISPNNNIRYDAGVGFLKRYIYQKK